MSNSHGVKSKLDLRTNFFQQKENDTGVSLCALISNFMHFTQVCQVHKDLKIAWKTSSLLLGAQVIVILLFRRII